MKKINTYKISSEDLSRHQRPNIGDTRQREAVRAIAKNVNDALEGHLKDFLKVEELDIDELKDRLSSTKTVDGVKTCYVDGVPFLEIHPCVMSGVDENYKMKYTQSFRRLF